MFFNREEIICGLDVGTTKITAVIADGNSSPKSPEIIGISSVPSHGLKRGIVVDIKETIHSISEAVQRAERVAGKKINRCLVGIAGDHIKSLNTSGKVSIQSQSLQNEPGEIAGEDIRRVLEHASDVRMPHDREIIHTLPQEYIVDSQIGIKDPLGLSGQVLESRIHLVTGSKSAVANLVKCVHQIGLKVEEIVLEPIASSEAVLDDDEKQLGVVLLDIGGGTTDVIVHYNGGVWYSGVIPVGGSNVTGDISALLRTSLDQAETIKRKFGTCLAAHTSRGETFPIDGVGGRGRRDVRHDLLVKYIEVRMDEIFDLALREAKKAEVFSRLAAGVVLTGGGALLDGAVELAEEKFQMPARKGVPRSFRGMSEELVNPQFATGLGLIRYGLKNESCSASPIRKPAIGIGKYFRKFKEIIYEML